MLRDDSSIGGVSGTRPLDGNEWQERVRRWLRLKYGTDFQPVPAMQGGDRAIEGYSLDGQVYQCYAARDGFDVNDLYKHQRDKLTEDIKHFIKYQNKLLQLLPQGFLVHRYCFVVPKYESAKLVEHINTKTAEVKTANLPFVAADFQIVILERDDFEVERIKEERSMLIKLKIEFSEPSIEDVTHWTAEHDQGVINLERKIPQFGSTRALASIRNTRDKWIRAHIRAANALNRLRQRSSDIWEGLDEVRSRLERRLELNYGNEAGPVSAVKAAAEELALEMQRQVPNLDRGDANDLADGIVADWLQKCSLLPAEEIQEHEA